MKKVLYSLLVAALMVGCAEKPSYTIDGTVANSAFEGKTVYMQQMVARSYVNVDSTTVTDGKFTFKGVQTEPALRFLNMQAEGDVALAPAVFILENGKLVATLDSNSQVAGTVLTDSLTQFLVKCSADGVDAHKAEALQLIKANNNNVLGAYVYHIYRATFTPEEQKELLVGAGDVFLNDENVARIKSRLDAMDAVAVGNKFVDLTMDNPEGTSVSLSDYAGKGKVVLIDFWASWCPPCRESMPGLVALYSKYKTKNFEIVGVSFDRTKEAWIKGIADLQITWPQMSDVKYWESEGAKVYAVRGIPHTVLLDKEGTIVAKDLHGEELEAKIVELLK
ncbi:MAG: thioredoxin-like domain-containing protein [Bacteroidales bacterium]